MATSKRHCSTNTAAGPQTAPSGRRATSQRRRRPHGEPGDFAPSEAWWCREVGTSTRPSRRGTTLAASSSSWPATTKGFPRYHVPNTNPPAHPQDPASKAARPEIEQGDEQIKQGEDFTLGSGAGAGEQPSAAATFNRRLRAARTAGRKKIPRHGCRPPQGRHRQCHPGPPPRRTWSQPGQPLTAPHRLPPPPNAGEAELERGHGGRRAT